MTSRVNLVVILLTLGCIVAALENTRLKKRSQSRYFIESRAFKGIHNKTLPVNSLKPRNAEIFGEKVGGVYAQNEIEDLSRHNIQVREESRGKKKVMDRALMALLMAYKMKFIALIPTMLGGLALLKGTALLAGFFFALFAAVLGLKVH